MNRASSAITGLVLCTIFMAFLMYLSVKYPGPSGQTIGVIEFIAIWLREIVILGFSLTVIVVYLVLKISSKKTGKTEVSSVKKEENESCT
jgi:TRAP-type C4-dicarboxylate transport system permease small subunit